MTNELNEEVLQQMHNAKTLADILEAIGRFEDVQQTPQRDAIVTAAGTIIGDTIQAKMENE